MLLLLLILIIINTYLEFLLNKSNDIKKPQKEDYGWQDGDIYESGGWMIEGGEDAYNEAMDNYELEQSKLK